MKEFSEILRASAARPDEWCALATLVRTRGSSYRRPGTRMLVTRDGQITGAISAGCLEEDVARVARDVIRSGEAQLVSYDTRRLYGCDGSIDVLVERMSTDGEWFRLARACPRERKAGLSLTIFAAEETASLGSFSLGGAGGQCSREEIEEIARDAAPRLLSHGNESALLALLQPPVRLVIAGANYDAVPLAELARGLGWDTIVLARTTDNLTAFRETQVFPVAEPGEYSFVPDARTAFVIMTHHYGRDFAFLRHLLPLPLGYIALMGPKRRREQLLSALFEDLNGLEPSDLRALRSPAGLDIGAQTPEEIALSIAAEIQGVMAASHLPLEMPTAFEAAPVAA
ncbi:MAG: XdhC family protein [Gemmatimonadaceae bacterium]|nr:XdhC family protein [Gemmatimonadaceae bacterium]